MGCVHFIGIKWTISTYHSQGMYKCNPAHEQRMCLTITLDTNVNTTSTLLQFLLDKEATLILLLNPLAQIKMAAIEVINLVPAEKEPIDPTMLAALNVVFNYDMMTGDKFKGAYNPGTDIITFCIGSDEFPGRFRWKKEIQAYTRGTSDLHSYRYLIRRPKMVRVNIAAYTVKETLVDNRLVFNYSPTKLPVIQRLVKGFPPNWVWLKVIMPHVLNDEAALYLAQCRDLSLHIEILTPPRTLTTTPIYKWEHAIQH